MKSKTNIELFRKLLRSQSQAGLGFTGCHLHSALLFATVIAGTFGMGASRAIAASDIWSAAPATANWVTDFGSTNWEGGMNAYPGSIAGSPLTNPDVATFRGTSSQTWIQINDASLNFGGITFGAGLAADASYTLGVNGGNPLFLSSGGAILNTALTPAAAATVVQYTVAAPIVIQNATGAATGSGIYSFSSTAGNTSATQNSYIQITGTVAGNASTGNTTTLTLNGSHNVNAGAGILANTATNSITGVISDGVSGGNLALTLTTPGTSNQSTQWTLSNSNTYSGGTSFTRPGGSGSGVLRVGTSSALGTGPVTWTTGGGTSSNGQILRANASDLVISNSLIIQSGVTARIDNNGLNPFTFGPGTGSGTGDISGAGNLISQGSGTTLLKGVNTYSGSTTIGGGTLAGIGANAFGSTSSIALGAQTLSLRGDASTSFVKNSDSSSYNISTTATGATINVNQATVAGTGAKTMTIGNIGTSSTAATYQVNFTGDNNTGLIAGAVTGAASTAAGTVTLNNTNVSGPTTLASYTSANSLIGENLNLNGAGNTTITGPISSTNAAVSALSITAGTNSSVTLNGTNTYSGQTSVNSGATLKLGNALALGSSVALSITTTSGSNLVTVPINSPVVVGQFVTAVGVPAFARVTVYNAATGEVTLNYNATASGSVPATFVGSTTVNSGGTLDLAGKSISEPIRSITGTGVGALGALVNSDTLNPASITGQIGCVSLTPTNSGQNPGSFTVGGAGEITLDTITSRNSFTLTKMGSGKLTMGGTVDNAYASGVLNGGTLVVNKSVNGHSFNIFTQEGGLLQYGPNTVPLLNGTGQINQVTLNGGVFDLNGNTNVANTTIGKLDALAAGASILNNVSGTTATLSVGGNNATGGSYAGTITDNNNAGTGKVALTKTGSGIQTLVGPHSYTGNTVVNGGTLSLVGATLTSDVTVASGASLGFTVGTQASTSGTVQFLGAAPTVTVTGTPAATTLMTAASFSGVVPVLNPAIAGWEIQVQDAGSSLKLVSTAGGFSSWINGPFANNIPEGQKGPNDDPDNDGISNLVEYAIAGQDPSVSNPNIGSYVGNTLSFDKNTAATGLTYAIVESTDLGVSDAWAEVTNSPGQVVYVNNATTISVAVTLTPGSPTKDFVRLRVISN